jgi:hypothetical protein
VSLRLFIEKYLTSKGGRYFEMFSAFGSFISCMFYIVSTYLDNGISFLEYIDISIMCLYFLEYLLRLFAA